MKIPSAFSLPATNDTGKEHLHCPGVAALATGAACVSYVMYEVELAIDGSNEQFGSADSCAYTV
jgi:hypothetical protein